MIYRRKTYIVDPSFVEDFNVLFNDILLPSQLKYEARLIGRWMINKDEERTEVFALWRVQQRLDEIGRNRLKRVLKEEIKQEFIESTVLRDKTILKKL